MRAQKEAEARVADSKVLSGFLTIASAGFEESSRGALARTEAEARVACVVIRVLVNFPKSSTLLDQALKRKEAEELLRKHKEAEALQSFSCGL